MSIWRKVLGCFNRTVLLCCFCIVVNAAVLRPKLQAAEPRQVSLPELLARTRQNPVLVQEFEAARQQAKRRLRQVKMERWLTKLNLRALTGVVPDVNADEYVEQKDASGFLFDVRSEVGGGEFKPSNFGAFGRVELQAVQPLFSWGKFSGYREMAEANVDVKEHERRKKLDEMLYMVKRAYYTLQLSRGALSILDDVKRRLDDAEEKAQQLLEDGSEQVEESDLLRMQVFRSDVQKRTVEAERGVSLARSVIEELANFEGVEWEVDQKRLEEEKVEDLEKDHVLLAALESKPKLEMLKKLLEIKKSERRVQKADLFPGFFLAGELHYGIAPGRTTMANPYLQDDFNRLHGGIAIGLQQDLGFHRNFNEVRIKDAEIEKLAAQERQLRKLVGLEVEEAFEEAVSAKKEISINEDGLRAARSWLTSVGLEFDLGTAEIEDLLESYGAYLKARFRLLQSTYQLNLSLASLSHVAAQEVVPRLEVQ